MPPVTSYRVISFGKPGKRDSVRKKWTPPRFCLENVIWTYRIGSVLTGLLDRTRYGMDDEISLSDSDCEFCKFFRLINILIME